MKLIFCLHQRAAFVNPDKRLFTVFGKETYCFWEFLDAGQFLYTTRYGTGAGSANEPELF